MTRDYSRELGLVGLSGLRLVRLPFGMAVHVRVVSRLLHKLPSYKSVAAGT